MAFLWTGTGLNRMHMLCMHTVTPLEFESSVLLYVFTTKCYLTHLLVLQSGSSFKIIIIFQKTEIVRDISIAYQNLSFKTNT